MRKGGLLGWKTIGLDPDAPRSARYGPSPVSDPWTLENPVPRMTRMVVGINVQAMEADSDVTGNPVVPPENLNSKAKMSMMAQIAKHIMIRDT
jgi:hypothetical protein